ncbi:hypothetical protein [Clostridium beijerinckii]|uniref:Uncharacterized protein n=1 Tax=Clostridium beijerinckii TaxID=1520 RepID=A0AAE5H9T1_CLOBE|nr:hypothetical protein [Clostridium beijerinckii]NSB17197.1 hypothetical protein [Clostridium beijerinckii]
MIIRADKEKLLKEFKKKYVINRYINEFKIIIEKYRKDRSIIKENLTSKFDLVCKEAIKLQEKELKGEIRYIYFSFLRTSLLESKGEWRIDLYDKKWFLDKEECSINIDFDLVYEPLFNHMSELLEKKKEYRRNINEVDIESIMLEEAGKYHYLVINIIEDMIESFLACSSYKEMKKKENIIIQAGEYMDSTTRIYPRKMIKQVY